MISGVDGVDIADIYNSPEFDGCSAEEVDYIMIERLNDAYGEEIDKPNPNYERAFLKVMKPYNISLFKATSDLSSWSEQQLEDTTENSNVLSKNCK